MKNILKTFVVISNLIVSCNNNSSQTINILNSEIIDSNSVTNHCYAYTGNKDSVFLNIQITGNVVTGNLKYNLYEKDKNNGTLQGKLNGDTFIAEYKFLSEGAKSVREVAFLKKANDFVEGYGDVVTVNNKIIFKNLNALNFSNTMLLKNVECEK